MVARMRADRLRPQDFIQAVLELLEIRGYRTLPPAIRDLRGLLPGPARVGADGAQVVSLVSPMETDQPMMRKSKSFAPLMRQRPEAVVKLWEAVHESTVIRSCAKRRSLCWTVFRGSAFMP
jgi:hypothetical protein